MERFFENVFSGIGITDIVDILIGIEFQHHIHHIGRRHVGLDLRQDLIGYLLQCLGIHLGRLLERCLDHDLHTLVSAVISIHGILTDPGIGNGLVAVQSLLAGSLDFSVGTTDILIGILDVFIHFLDLGVFDVDIQSAQGIDCIRNGFPVYDYYFLDVEVQILKSHPSHQDFHRFGCLHILHLYRSAKFDPLSFTHILFKISSHFILGIGIFYWYYKSVPRENNNPSPTKCE